MKNKLLTFILFLVTTIHVYAQNRTISGVVTDASSNLPISGVSIKAIGTNYLTQSDNQGKFQIQINQTTKELLFSFIGYTSEKATINSSNNISVSLNSSASDLEELVIIGYGTQSRKDFIGSSTTVKMNDLADVPLSTIESALQGRATGVFVNSVVENLVKLYKLGSEVYLRFRQATNRCM